MSDQQIVFKVVLDDSGVPAASTRAGEGIRRVGASATQSSGAMLKFAESGKASAAQMQALSYQTTDIVTSLAGGQSPFLVLLQQGGQLRDQFGGVGNVFKAVASVATPAAVGVTAVGLATAALAVAAYQGYSETSKLTKELALNGYAAGVTRGQINQMAVDLAAASGGSIGDARAAMAGLATSGAFVGTTLEVAGRAVLSVQRLSGQATEDIVKGFAGMRSGVAAWAAENNRAYNFLTGAQYQHIRALEAQGRTQEAMRYALGELATTMESRAVPALGSLERGINAVKAAGSGFWDWLKGIGRAETVEEQLSAVTSQLAAFERNIGNFNGGSERRALVDAERKRLVELQYNLQEQLRMQNRGAEAKAAAAQQNQREIAESSQGFIGAQIAADAAAQAKQLAQQVAAGQARRIALERDHAQFLISGEAYRDGAIAIERERADAEVALARNAVEAEKRRSPASPQEAIARTQAITAAETRLVQELAKRAQLEADIANGKLDPKARQALETAQASFRLSELQNEASAEYDRWLRDQAVQTAALARATTDYSFALEEQAAAQALAYDRDLGGRRLGDNARQQADRMAALADQYNAEKARLDGDLRNGRLTQTAYDERLQLLRSYYDRALGQEQAYQDRRARLEADATVGFDRALNNYLESSRDVAGQTERMWSGVFSGLEDGLVRFATTGKLNFGELARSVVADLIRIQIRAQLAGVFGQLGSMLGLGSGGGSEGLGNGAPFGGVGAFAQGGIFGTSGGSAGLGYGAPMGGLSAFAMGGIVNRPTMFRFAQGGAMRNGLMGEAGPEAIMPLRRGADGNLGVLAGGAGRNQPMQLNLSVVNNTGTPAKASATQRSNGDIELLLEAVDQGMAERASNGRGAHVNALQQRFGLRAAMG